MLNYEDGGDDDCGGSERDADGGDKNGNCDDHCHFHFLM